MTAYNHRLGPMMVVATCLVALSVPAVAAASVARCNVNAHIPFLNPDGGKFIIYGAGVVCKGSVALHDVLLKLQKQRSNGSWHTIDTWHSGHVRVRRHHNFVTGKDCPGGLNGTFRTIGIITMGPNSEMDVSDESDPIHCHVRG